MPWYLFGGAFIMVAGIIVLAIIGHFALAGRGSSESERTGRRAAEPGPDQASGRDAKRRD